MFQSEKVYLYILRKCCTMPRPVGGELHPPTQETTALAVEECVTPDRISVSDDCVILRRISLIGG
jgi:hypothetical protein